MKTKQETDEEVADLYLQDDFFISQNTLVYNPLLEGNLVISVMILLTAAHAPQAPTLSPKVFDLVLPFCTEKYRVVAGPMGILLDASSMEALGMNP